MVGTIRICRGRPPPSCSAGQGADQENPPSSIDEALVPRDAEPSCRIVMRARIDARSITPYRRTYRDRVSAVRREMRLRIRGAPAIVVESAAAWRRGTGRCERAEECHEYGLAAAIPHGLRAWLPGEGSAPYLCGARKRAAQSSRPHADSDALTSKLSSRASSCQNARRGDEGLGAARARLDPLRPLIAAARRQDCVGGNCPASRAASAAAYGGVADQVFISAEAMSSKRAVVGA